MNFDKEEAQLKQEMEEAEVVVIRSRFRITKELLTRAKKLKCIARAGAGMENIDVVFATSQGIRCVHAPEGNKDAVAEHALGMLLMLLNHLNRADREVRNGVWLREANRGIELNAKKVGIVGYGNMGSAFAQRLTGFGVEILVYDKYKSGFETGNIRECAMKELFDECDIVSLHVPLTAETNNLVCRDWINQFRKPVYIINTARGRCLNTADLVEGIKHGKVLGACLDVLEYESVSFEKVESSHLPLPFQELIQSDQVVLSPHIAGWTQESNVKIASILAEKIIDVFHTK